MGLDASTSFERRMLPTSFMRCGCETETPCVRLKAAASSEVSIAVMSTPPRRVKPRRLLSPCVPSPGRMSSVESSNLPRFGVSSVVFQGIGLPHIGIPCTTEPGSRPTGAKTITSYFALRFASRAAVCVLM